MSDFSEKPISVLYWSHKAFCAGNIVTGLLQCSNVDTSTIISVQAYGHIFVDKRWIRSKVSIRDMFLPVTNTAVNHAVNIPPALFKPNESVCIYSTPVERLDFDALLAEGVVLQFELPVETLPSFRGLSCSILYFLTVTFSTPNNNSSSGSSGSSSSSSRDAGASIHQQTHFPFIVYGRGSASTPQYLGHSALVHYPLSSIPCESLLSQPAIEDDFYENQRRISAYNSADAAVYAIRDIKFVCTVCVGLSSATYCAGDMVTLCLDFENNVQPCHAVRAKLVQCEKRADGSRLQEKTLDTVFRSTDNAVSVYLLMHVPDIVECSFKCPFASVDYLIEVDFFLQPTPPGTSSSSGTGDASTELPLAWSMGIDVLPLCYQSINPTVELIQCLEPGAIKVIKTVSC